MDLRETFAKNLADRLDDQLPLLTNEEATKNALIMPVINALGYNVFDPTEVLPEFTADLSITKKGEKVDYAINVGGSPMMLVECAVSVTSDLKFEHASQLFRYFGCNRRQICDSYKWVLATGFIQDL